MAEYAQVLRLQAALEAQDEELPILLAELARMKRTMARAEDEMVFYERKWYAAEKEAFAAHEELASINAHIRELENELEMAVQQHKRKLERQLMSQLLLNRIDTFVPKNKQSEDTLPAGYLEELQTVLSETSFMTHEEFLNEKASLERELEEAVALTEQTEEGIVECAMDTDQLDEWNAQISSGRAAIATAKTSAEFLEEAAHIVQQAVAKGPSTGAVKRLEEMIRQMGEQEPTD